MDQSITIKIAGNEYPLKAATPQIEQMMRIAAETIGKKLSAYDAKYPNKSLADKLSFVALNETVGRLSLQKKLEHAEEEARKLQEQMEAYLNTIEKNGRESHVQGSTKFHGTELSRDGDDRPG
ncbi:MAG: cell division protein ZapA [Bacteroidales bacterium]|nr:cell division protein ZapA [Bacteroidales bacterium]